MNFFILEIYIIKPLCVVLLHLLIFSIFTSDVFSFELEKNLYSDQTLTEPTSKPVGLFQLSNLFLPTRQKTTNISTSSVLYDSNTTMSVNKDETLLAEISYLSVQLSQKELELAGESAQKAQILSELKKIKLEQEANNQLMESLKAIKLREFGSGYEKEEFKNRITHINGWYFVENRGWFWTNSQVFPMIFSAVSSNWLYSELCDDDLQIFFNYQTQEWETW